MPILFLVVSSVYLLSLQYWSNNVVSLFSSLKFSFVFQTIQVMFSMTLTWLVVMFVWIRPFLCLANLWWKVPSLCHKFHSAYLWKLLLHASQIVSVLCTYLWLPHWILVVLTRIFSFIAVYTFQCHLACSCGGSSVFHYSHHLACCCLYNSFLYYLFVIFPSFCFLVFWLFAFDTMLCYLPYA